MRLNFRQIVTALFTGALIGSVALSILGAWHGPILAIVALLVIPPAGVLLALAISQQGIVEVESAFGRETQRLPKEVNERETISGILGLKHSGTVVVSRSGDEPGHHSSDLHLSLREDHPAGPARVEDRSLKLLYLYETLRRIPGVMVYHTSKESSMLYGGVRSLIGYSVADIDAMPNGMGALIHPDDRERDSKAEADWVANGKLGVLTRRARFQHRDGHWIWLEDRMLIDSEEDPNLDSKTGVILDVSTEEAAKADAIAARTQSALALSVTGFGVWEHHLESNIIEQDEHCKALLGIDPEGASNTLEYWRTRTHPEDLARVGGFYAAMLSGERDGYESTVRISNVDGGYKHIHTLARVHERDEKGQAKKVIGIVRDVSETVAKDRVLRESQRLESLGVLAGGIAHDFNNYLGAILGYSSLALSTLDPSHKAFSHIESAVNGAERASDLTKQLLAYSGKGSFYIEPLSLGEVVDSISSLIQVTIPKKIELANRVPSNLPNVRADRAQLQQVVLNLITNAADAIGENGGEVKLGASRVVIPKAKRLHWRVPSLVSEEEFIHFSVRDSGVGMNEETLSHLFEPFFTTKDKGHGLGLAAIVGIVRSHRGGIDIESREGEGTTFHIYLPTTKEVASLPPEAPEPTRQSGELSILVVDDDDGIREFVFDYLTSLGHRVELAHDGAEGLAKVRENVKAYDLVIMDLTMPIMGGAESASLMHESLPGLPIILSSGFSESDSMQDMASTPNLHFLQKPYLPDAMSAKIELAISRAKA